MQFLRHHHSPHYGVHEQRQEDIAKENEDTHHGSNDCLLCGAQHSAIAAHQHAVQSHRWRKQGAFYFTLCRYRVYTVQILYVRQWVGRTDWFSLFTACSDAITSRESGLYVEGRVAGGKTKARADVEQRSHARVGRRSWKTHARFSPCTCPRS